jgi:hypothetical protein
MDNGLVRFRIPFALRVWVLGVLRMTEPRNPGFERAVRESFTAQELMATMGARLTRVAHGEIEIRVPFRAT